MDTDVELYFKRTEIDYFSLSRCQEKLSELCLNAKMTEEWKNKANKTILELGEIISICKSIIVPTEIRYIHDEYNALLDDVEMSAILFGEYVSTLDERKTALAFGYLNEAKTHITKAGIFKKEYYESR